MTTEAKKTLKEVFCAAVVALAVITAARETKGYTITQLTFEPSYEGEPAWSPDGSKIAFVSDRDGNREIYVMDANGSNQSRLTNSQPGYGAISPAWSPDGEKIAYISVFACGPSSPQLKVIHIPSGGTQYLADDAYSPSWSPDGNYIVFSRCVGEVCYPNIYRMNLDGNQLTFLREGSEPAWAPAGDEIVFVSWPDVYIMDANGTGIRQLTYDSAIDIYPAWSPRGDVIAFSSNRSGNFDIWTIPTSGGEPLAITDNPADDRSPTWSPNGSRIAFESDGDIWVVSGISDRTADLYPDGKVDFRDLAVLANSWSQREPLADIAPDDGGDGMVDYLDLAKLCQEWLETEEWYEP